MMRTGGRWQPLTPGDEAQAVERQRTARWALGEIDSGGEGAWGDVCFPMIAAGAPVGVLCVAAEPPLTEHTRTTLAAAAALLAVSPEERGTVSRDPREERSRSTDRVL